MEPSHGVRPMNSSFQWMPMSATFSVALDRMGSLRHPPPTVMASCSSSANELHCGAGRYLLSPPEAIVERTRGWPDEEVASGGGAAAQRSVQVVVVRALVQLGAIKEAEDGGAAQDG